MKHYFSSSVIILLFVLFLGFPQQVFAGASTGLTLWFQVIFPTLLPFIILSNLMIHTSAIHILAKALSPVLSRLFGVSDYGTFAILTGFLCGYPMGSKVTADLVKEGFISRKEGQYLLGICNNTSPMFIISYLMWQSLKLQKQTIPSLIILFLSPVIVSILLRRFQGDLQTKYKNMSAPLISKSLTDVLDFCIMNGFETIAKIGGYMMLFSIFFTLIDTFVQVRSTDDALYCLPGAYKWRFNLVPKYGICTTLYRSSFADFFRRLVCSCSDLFYDPGQWIENLALCNRKTGYRCGNQSMCKYLYYVFIMMILFHIIIEIKGNWLFFGTIFCL